MPKYSQQEEEQDRRRVTDALHALDSFRKNYQDVIAISEVITLAEVAEMVMDTPRGPIALANIASRDELVAVLRALEQNPCTPDPTQVAYYAINDYREQHPSTPKES